MQACAAASWEVKLLTHPQQAYMDRLSGATALNGLDALHVPEGPAGVSAGLSLPQTAARVRAAYPPRGGMRLLGRAYLEGDLPAMERIMVEEYVLDTLAALSSDR